MNIISRISILFLFLIGLVVTPAVGQELDNGRIPFFAAPVYNYQPLTIKVGKHSKELKTNDPNELLKTAEKIRADIDNTNIETLYVLSVRLYDLGKKDESFYWFHTAKGRARVFVETLDKQKVGGMGSPAFELKQLFNSFNQLAGTYINGYGFNDLEKGMAIMGKVREEVKDIKSLAKIYPKVVFLDSILEEAKRNKEKDFDETLAYIRDHKEEIQKSRIEAGIQDKY